MRKVAINALLVLISVGLTLFAIEAGAKLYLKHVAASQPSFSDWQARSLPTGPYKDAPWYGEDFRQEQQKCHRWRFSETDGLLYNPDFHGLYINYENSKRRTTDEPVQARRTVHLYGGSTMACEQVPDQDTIASALQRLLLASHGGEWRVVNHGAASAVLSQQLRRLELSPPARGDVVVFYDGYNDIYQSLYVGDPQGTIGGASRKAESDQPWHVQVYVWAWKKARKYSRIVDTLLNPYASTSPRPLHVSQEGLSPLAMELGRNVYNISVQAQALAQRNGAVFYHFLQPTVFTKVAPTAFEGAVVQFGERLHPGTGQAMRVGYDILRKAFADMRAGGLAAEDLTTALDQAPGEVFVDTCHVNHVANALIARAIHRRIAPDLARASLGARQ